MNYKNRNNYKVISGKDYAKLNLDMKLSYFATTCEPTHSINDDSNSLISLALLGTVLTSDFNPFNTLTILDTPELFVSPPEDLFDGFGGGDFGGGGAGGEF